ncbi:MAG: 23S rRNA (uracil(1939)-C(5))-methyltransferase RlmD [Marinilabiliaceae bacterium]|nr:23S rRNA (uracil(1939)-C(5))-methyltransferase RlmD [Marinilabiliaceae bacterium]
MGRNKKDKPVLVGIEITDVAAEGKALCRIDDKVVFVNGAVPGDIVDIQITRKRSSFMEGNAINFHKYSEDRVAPMCKYFGTCGGCKWQTLPYEKQLFYKEREVTQNLKRLGKIELPEPLPILASANREYYRNKLEYTFSNRRWLTEEEIKNSDAIERNGVGFHIPGLFDKVVDIDDCHLQQSPSNEIRNWIRDYALKNGVTFYDLRAQQGMLRTLVIRTASTGDIMVIVAFGEDNKATISQLLDDLKAAFPQITSLMYAINTKVNDSLTDQTILLYSGQDYIMEEMEGIHFKIGPKSFYQTNSLQAYELYKQVREFADLGINDVVYDLYTGTGTIANFVARRCKKVVGIEYVPEAIEDAKVNSQINDINNTEFFAGDMKDVLTLDFINQHGKPDVVIVDPPRAGMHPDVVNTLIKVAAPKLIYVSCNSATQARDLQMLDKYYKVVAYRPVDMFPHTHHVESVVSLQLR